MLLKEKSFWIEILRVFAIFGVVLLHIASPIVAQYGNVYNSYWIAAHFYDSIVRVCVPIFFMISGYLLLRKTESAKLFYKKRFINVIIPFIAWSIIYYLWNIYFTYELQHAFEIFYQFLFKPIEYHMWFLYILVGIYLVTPILRIILKKISNRVLTYMLVTWFLIVSIISYLYNSFSTANEVSLTMLLGYGGYFVIGYYLGKIKLSKNHIYIITFVMIISFLITLLGTYSFSRTNNIFFEYFYDYLSFNIILFSTTSFLILKYLFEDLGNNESHSTLNILGNISSAGLGIYLIHPIIIFHLNKGFFGITLNGLIGNPLIFIPITAIVVFSVSLIAITIIKKIPILKYIV